MEPTCGWTGVCVGPVAKLTVATGHAMLVTIATGHAMQL